MPGGLREGELSDDSSIDFDTNSDGQVNPFDCIDDVTVELRALEDYVAPVRLNTFMKIIARLEKSETLQKRQPNNKSTQTDAYDEEVTDSEPDSDPSSAIENMAGYLSSPALMDKLSESSKQLKNVAEIRFNDEFLKKLHQLEKDSGVDVHAVSGMVKQRTAHIKNAEYVYSLIDQHQFDRELLAKANDYKQIVATDMFQELIDFRQLKALKPGQCPFSRYLSDFDLLNCIMRTSNNDAERVSALQILCGRKLRMEHLHFGSNFGSVVLRVGESCVVDDSYGIDDPAYRKFLYGVEEDDVSSLDVFRLFNFIIQFYDMSTTILSLTYINYECYPGIPYHHMAVMFTLLKEKNGKVRIGEMIIQASEMIQFLQWFAPDRITISCDPKTLINTPALISGVTAIECRKIDVDQFMENCITGVIRLEDSCEWSDESVVRVLSAHRLGSGKGCPREISYRCDETETRTVKCWRELFESWSSAFEEEHGKIGRKVTFGDNNIDYITLTLHEQMLTEGKLSKKKKKKNAARKMEI